jgi:hypothetical protein
MFVQLNNNLTYFIEFNISQNNKLIKNQKIIKNYNLI